MAVDRLNVWSVNNAPRDKVWVRVQNPVAFLDLESEPEPDVVWAARRDYADGHPTGPDVLLLIEVADSSLEFDRIEKAELYAAAGVQEYWIANLVDRAVEVRRDPREGRYCDVRSYASGTTIAPLAAPEAVLNVATVFGTSK